MIATCGNKALDDGIKCGEVISKVCSIANGKGGGKPDLAQGGGSDADPQILVNEVENMLK